MKLVWSKAALRDLIDLADYIAEDSEQAAELTESRIENTARLVSRFPRLGARGRVPGTRECVVPGTPYIVVYRLLPRRVHIVRVYHGARRWPARFD